MGHLTLILLLINFNYIFGLSLKPCLPTCDCSVTSVRCLNQKLQTIPKTPANIETLDLRFNEIKEIPKKAFVHLHRLRSLLLNDNQLQALHSGDFHGLRRLKYLYLYRNQIKEIDSNVFQTLVHLQQLYLHVNEIHKIEPETFSNMPRLERLYLQNNRLKTIPNGSFKFLPRLHKLRLDSNALVCDCSMLWFVKMLKQQGHMNIAATCYEPMRTMGTPVALMTEKDFKCQHPEIDQNPDDVTVNFGENAMFTCVATGDPTPDIVWYHDSNEISTGMIRYEIMDNGTLMVHDAGENDVGVFECMAKNSEGEARSRQARMVIQNSISRDDYLVFTVTPQDQMVRINQPFVSFDCIAKGNPKPHIAWFFNKEKIVLNERIALKKNGSLFIQPVEATDGGNYTCQAKNVHGKILHDAQLKVMVPPAFITVPKDKTVAAGDSAEFTCQAKGVPTPAITWYKDTFPLKTSPIIKLSNSNQKLTIVEVTKDDEGTYHCRAENLEGLTEITVILKVQEVQMQPPRILLKPEDTDAFKETSIQLPCEVESEPTANVEWRKDGSRIVPNERISITLIGSLIINNVTVADAGRYECSVFNEFGRDSVNISFRKRSHVTWR